jgi:hypothetical protein
MDVCRVFTWQIQQSVNKKKKIVKRQWPGGSRQTTVAWQWLRCTAKHVTAGSGSVAVLITINIKQQQLPITIHCQQQQPQPHPLQQPLPLPPLAVAVAQKTNKQTKKKKWQWQLAPTLPPSKKIIPRRPHFVAESSCRAVAPTAFLPYLRKINQQKHQKNTKKTPKNGEKIQK